MFSRLSCTEFSIKFSCVNLIQGSILWLTLRSLNHNIASLEEIEREVEEAALRPRYRF